MSAINRIVPVHRSTARLRPADNLVRAATAALMAQTRAFGGPANAARKLFPGDDVSWRLLVPPHERTGSDWIQRAAVSGATTGDAAWAGTLAQQAVGDFFSSLSNSAATQLVSFGTRLAIDGDGELVIPRRSGSPAALAWVEEGQPIPARAPTVGSTTVGPMKKLAATVALSRELARRSAALDAIAFMLREDAATSLDGSIFSDAAASDARPAGLLNGVTPLTATAGGGVDALNTDLMRLAAAVAAGGGTTLAIVTSPRMAAALAILRPDLTISVWPSSAVADGTIIGVDPTAFVSVFGADAEITASASAVLHMEDTTPLQIGTVGTPATVAAPVRSMFQTAQIAVRVVSEVAWAMRSEAIAVINDATW